MEDEWSYTRARAGELITADPGAESFVSDSLIY